MGFVDSLSGPTLILAICVLLFIEELGVPLPFAPGDVLLVIGGIGIASGRANPALMVPFVLVACIVGAVLGREITALLGWQRLMRLARPLHAEKPLDRAAQLMRRGGWRTVFTARLIPGLRVYTTQVAGLTGVPRSTFLAGLIPSSIVYVAGFLGLGAAFGRPVLALIHQSQNKLVFIVLGVALMVPAVLGFRVVARRTLEGLAIGGWNGPFRLRLDPLQFTVLPLCLGINFAGHGLAQGLKLPLFLDSAGTILAGVMAGPWVGGSVGVVSNLLASNTFDPIAGSYAIVSFALGFTAGLSRYLGWQTRPSRWMLLGIICLMVSALLATPINFAVSGGQSGVGFGDAIYASLTLPLPRVVAAFLGELAVDFPDKLLSVAIALAIAQAFTRQPEAATVGVIDIDLKEPLGFVFRSPRWRRRTLAGVLCFGFAWLLVPGLLLLGYLVELSRQVRDGNPQLPSWDQRWLKIKDGFAVATLFVIWSLPGLGLLLIAGILADPTIEGVLGSVSGRVSYVVSAIGNAWLFLVLVTQVAVWAQYLRGGFRAALRLSAIVDRLRFNLSLTVVMAGLTMILLVIGAVGLIGLLIGVVATLTYMSYVWAYLAGKHAHLTDFVKPTIGTLVSSPRGRAEASGPTRTNTLSGCVPELTGNP
jgi:energy-coupling factor transport system substrate-specific component